MTAPPRRQQYGPEFYERIRKGSQDSAAVIVPMVLANMGKVESVLDVGCGEGYFAAEFERHGCRVTGIESGEVVQPAIESILKWDLMLPFGTLLPPVDLVVCLEVAEHLPESRAESFIADLCQAGRAVLFSAAIPGQGGDGHLNCQYPKYWSDLFSRVDYVLSMAPRWEIWDDQRVKPWYRNNLGIAIHGRRPVAESGITGNWFETEAMAPHAVIHPDMWIDWKSAYTGPR